MLCADMCDISQYVETCVSRAVVCCVLTLAIVLCYVVFLHVCCVVLCADTCELSQ